MMTKQSVINQISKYNIDVNKTMNDLEEALSNKNISFNNIIAVITYNRESEMEFSLVTTPSHDIHIKSKKL
ncbi:MAG: hypothetical protein IJF92_00650 [Bacilli bacterium]|nr:hypothetical protein [Bacilli bacterium]MBQ3307677.1 hypothetical protein [Bacilli bacterium]